MECIENECFCKKYHTIANNSICLSLLLGVCHKDEDCAVENSVCSKDKCKCKKNYVMENTSTCSKS